MNGCIWLPNMHSMYIIKQPSSDNLHTVHVGKKVGVVFMLMLTPGTAVVQCVHVHVHVYLHGAYQLYRMPN